MSPNDYAYWRDGDWFIGYLVAYPDYQTQGETLDDLVEHLADLAKDLGGVWLVRRSPERERRGSCPGVFRRRFAGAATPSLTLRAPTNQPDRRPPSLPSGRARVRMDLPAYRTPRRMPLDWSPLTDFLARHDRPLLMTHIRPDADGLGSQLALRDALVRAGKRPRVAVASKLPPRYEFLDPRREVIEDFRGAGENFADCDCVVVLDTGTYNQLGDFGDYLKARPVPRAVVDHHRTQDDLGGLRFVDTTAESTGRLAYEISRALGLEPTPAAANHLFMAVATDTGWFRHPNATAATFALAAELVALGANPTELYERLYEAAPLARLKLTGVAIDRLKVRAGGKVAYTEILLSDYPATGAVPGDTEDLITFPRSVEGVEVALVFIEQPGGGTKVSFRAKALDVSRLAERFGGGGHKLASGARVDRPLPQVRDEVLAAVEAALAAA